jgi:hypothetical protein
MSTLVSDQDRANRRSISHVLDGDSGRRRSTEDRFSASISAHTSLTVEKRGSCTKMMGRQIASKQETRKICPAIDRRCDGTIELLECRDGRSL